MNTPAHHLARVLLTGSAVLAASTNVFGQASTGNASAPAPKAGAGVRSTFEPPAAAILDVALSDQGIVHGHAVDEEGKPVDGALIVIRRDDEVVHKLVTNTQGQFAAEGLRPGVYAFSTVQGATLYRVWPKNIAPPSARPHALVKVGRPVMRAQFGRSGALSQLATMALAGGALGVGIVSLDKLDDLEGDVRDLKSP